MGESLLLPEYRPCQCSRLFSLWLTSEKELDNYGRKPLLPDLNGCQLFGGIEENFSPPPPHPLFPIQYPPQIKQRRFFTRLPSSSWLHRILFFFLKNCAELSQISANCRENRHSSIKKEKKIFIMYKENSEGIRCKVIHD
jgi:hypothetical protein